MAVLAPPDWYPPRDSSMDVPSTNSSSVPRQRSSPITDNPSSAAPLSHHLSQQSYPYPIQQPQGGWTPSITAQPFYPSFYQNHHPQQQQQQQQSYALHGQLTHSSQAQMPSQVPFFDPNNAQLAQWAYQQMMFSTQQGFPHISPHHTPLPSQSQRNTPNPSNDYFTPPAFKPFPSGTPPPSNFSGSHRSGAVDHQNSPPQYNGFHPYRRPTRQPTHNPDAPDWLPPAHPQPPYAHKDASGSTSSLNSGSSHGHNTSSSRQRTNSAQSAKSSSNGSSPHTTASGTVRSRNGAPQIPTSSSAHGRTGSGNSSSSSSATPSPQRVPHNRNLSSSSSGSATPRTSAASIASGSSIPVARPVRPSPLSQGTFTAAEKRMSRDDSELDPAPTAAMIRSGGLKGRLRRALSFNVSATLRENSEDDDASIKATSSKPKIFVKTGPATNLPSTSSTPPTPDGTDEPSTPTAPAKKKSRAASLFNSRLNASTDNISLSSTVSSASVMIRKLGKLARRNSLAGITSLFKDKKEKDDNSGDKKGKKKSSKGEASEASVSHVTAELDRTNSGDWSSGSEMSGLSPAAKLARQHTLKSNAEAAARAKAQLEAISVTTHRGVNGAGTPATWERSTMARQASPIKRGAVARVNEDGTRVLVEDDDSASDDGSEIDHYERLQQQQQSNGGQNVLAEVWDDEDEWGEGEEDEDVTIRVGFERTSLDDVEEETVSWAVNVRRSVEKARKPSKGILKDAGNYNQQTFLIQPIPNRGRSNSYNSHPGPIAELGPLARIPSPDPDHIDGLHRHPSYSSTHSHHTIGPAPLLPPLAFEFSGGLGLDSPKKLEMPRDPSPETISRPPHLPEKSPFNHPNFNSSAPALSTMLSSGPPTLTHRSATAPVKRLMFASSLSVYDTFSSTMYDRRSEPATWSRLTPALAQQIKEELNSYKMEEMEVHAASRIHTQFFV